MSAVNTGWAILVEEVEKVAAFYGRMAPLFMRMMLFCPPVR
jgi:hypothetical protein